MLSVRRLTEETLDSVKLLADAVLIGEETMLRIGRYGFELSYLPRPSAEWRSFPAPEEYSAKELIKQQNAAVFAAYVDERVVGLASVICLSSGWAELCDIRVDAAHRRQGVATALIAACERFVIRQGMHGLRVTASESNPVLCQFLQHNGFALQGLDRRALIHTPAECDKPLMRRACALYFYRETEKG